MIIFYTKHVKNAAQNQYLLNDYLKGSKKKDKQKIKWSEEGIKPFEKCKEKLVNVALLPYPINEQELVLFVDASDYAIGSVL